MNSEQRAALAKEFDQRGREGREMEGMVPVKIKEPRTSPRNVFSVRLSSEELVRISETARSLNLSTGDFIRIAAMAATQETEQTKKMVAWEKARALVQEAAAVMSEP